MPKAGTTSLANALQKHPKIFIPEAKELHFFNSDVVKNVVPFCTRTKCQYLRQFNFAKPNQICGEASVFYFMHGQITIPRIKKMLGNYVSLLIILRNPIERAFSAYRYTTALNADANQSFLDAIKREIRNGIRNDVSPMLNYIDCGMYAENLKLWKDEFPNIHIMLFDDLKNDANSVVFDATRFLGLVPSNLQKNVPKMNVSPGEWKNPYIASLIKKIATKKIRNYGKKVSIEYYYKLRLLIFSIFLKQSLKMNAIEFEVLKKIYEKDIVETGKILNRDLKHWLLYDEKGSNYGN